MMSAQIGKRQTETCPHKKQSQITNKIMSNDIWNKPEVNHPKLFPYPCIFGQGIQLRNDYFV